MLGHSRDTKSAARGAERSAGRLRLLRRLVRLALVGSVILVLAGVVCDQFVLPFPEAALTRPNSAFVYSREGKLLSAFTSTDHFWRQPVTLDSISPRLVASVLTIEDRYFYWHFGVNPISLVQAALANYRAGRTVRGGSTLTMQIARMMEPKERTISSKLLEMFRAIQLELRYSKEELLSCYFNLAPYGGNIEGVGAATHFYFEKEPSRLTWSEAALLTAIPGSPERFRPDRYLERGRKRSEVILWRLLESEVITEQQFADALAEVIPSQRVAVPNTAPHLSLALRSESPEVSRFNSTLNLSLQQTCERIAKSYGNSHVSKDIHNLAIVAIDNRTSEVIAWVGSPDFYDQLHGGQVDAVTAPRSPGSTLKPFIYALAFESGELAPEQMVADIPVNYGGYRPVNYDEEYRGVISVRDALTNSLNIPAVNATSQVGLRSLHETLRSGGISTLDKPFYLYGLPLILGACEVKLVELTNLYATFAREGVYRPVSMQMEQVQSPGHRMCTVEAAYLLSDILVDVKRPNLPEYWQSTKDGRPIAWKTGTSYGRRDAWAVGYTPVYTVGVWVGNCDGAGSVNLVGAEVAAPILFDVFSYLNQQTKPIWFERPDGVRERKVCAVSGQPAGEYCHETRTELFIVGKSPIVTCEIHQPIFVDKESGLRLKPDCVKGRSFEREIAAIWPARLATWLVEHGMAAPVPSYDPACLATTSERQPCIVSPEDGTVFELVREVPAEYQKIRLQASISTGEGTVHWFLDGVHFATVTAGETTFYVPTPGYHTVMCLDDAGRSATSTITVN